MSRKYIDPTASGDFHSVKAASRSWRIDPDDKIYIMVEYEAFLIYLFMIGRKAENATETDGQRFISDYLGKHESYIAYLEERIYEEAQVAPEYRPFLAPKPEAYQWEKKSDHQYVTHNNTTYVFTSPIQGQVMNAKADGRFHR